jgi:hypothetical protein
MGQLTGGWRWHAAKLVLTALGSRLLSLRICFVRRGFPDPAVRLTGGLHLSRRRSGTGTLTVAEAGGLGDHCRTSLHKTIFSPVLNGRLVENSRDSCNFASHQFQHKSLRLLGLRRKSNRRRMIFWFWTRPAFNATPWCRRWRLSWRGSWPRVGQDSNLVVKFINRNHGVMGTSSHELRENARC